MEAATLPKKKVNKGKIKKTVKNVLSRPDTVFWPIVSEEHGAKINKILENHKIEVPPFKKSHWNELKLIPKEKRPKPPKLMKVKGLLFGMSECSNAIHKQQCSLVILESTVNPRIIVTPIIELCVTKGTPVICLKDLRKTCLRYFGIATSCLGIMDEYLNDLSNEFLKIANHYKSPLPKTSKVPVMPDKPEKMEVDQLEKTSDTNNSVSESLYLYRPDKKTRIFIPNQSEVTCSKKDFTGQNFIKLTDKQAKESNSKQYMKMILKKITNNPNRVKRK